ncbi:MAG: excinuclease ABC subunit UvrC [Deltaproteobacteria bacterium]|nr:excinuclease ABC subunit UvrC [Deltaproteobacteria bacterium]
MIELSENKQSLHFEALRSQLPEEPGVYLFKDSSGAVVYVGKAKNLKKRVLSYYRQAERAPQKTLLMIQKARFLEYIITSNEKEAFILESNLIKKHLPRYNIILRDDKQYPWLRLAAEEDYPNLTIVRKPHKDGALYFGPFSSAGSVRSTVKLIDRIFNLRKCRSHTLPNRSRPCINFQLGRCLGPCSGGIPPSTYKEVVEQVRLFLEGRRMELMKSLKKNMETAAQNLDFEKAAAIRDQIKSVERTIEKQHVVAPRMGDQDVIGLARQNGAFLVALLMVRGGYLTGSREFLLKSRGGSAKDALEAFLKQHYPGEPVIPKHILISEAVGDLRAIGEWISDAAGRRVLIEKPSRGEKLRLIKIAVANAENLLKNRLESSGEDLIRSAQSVLLLDKIPRTMEGIDISNISGEMAVGAMVTFVDGLPHKQGYRNYRIKGDVGVDDYAMMAELVTRRLSAGPPPDLFVVDGGKGHLRTVKKVADRFCPENAPGLVSIAKGKKIGEMDRIYLHNRKNPLTLREGHPVLLLLMRIRDEAHRRAVGYHRKLRARGIKLSDLDCIPGIGPKRKRLLMNHFGSLEAIAGAETEELAKVPGISTTTAKEIFRFFGGIIGLTQQNELC